MLRPQLFILERQGSVLASPAPIPSGSSPCPAAPRKQALLIIQLDKLLRLHRQGFRLFWKRRSRTKTNLPKLNRETIDLIRRLAQENGLWGSERIQGELLKLGIAVATRTVQKYMRGVRTPRAWGQTWATILKIQEKAIWAWTYSPWWTCSSGRPLSFS